MRLYVLSDIHAEFEPFLPSQVEVDAVILAGDINHGLKGLEWAATRFAGVPTLYVAGNHEYYGEALPKLTDQLRERAAELGVYFLENGAVDLGSVRFLGCTLWTDLQLCGSGPWIMDAVRNVMVDYRAIRVSPQYRRLLPGDTIRLHRASVTWLRQELNNGVGPVVVVTHHAPSARSLVPNYADDPVSAAFASDLDELVASPRLQLWIHGHTHRAVDYRIGTARIVSNPRGYPDEDHTGFVEDFVVSLPDDFPGAAP
jgi:predicted phosphohydrolase